MAVMRSWFSRLSDWSKHIRMNKSHVLDSPVCAGVWPHTFSISCSIFTHCLSHRDTEVFLSPMISSVPRRCLTLFKIGLDPKQDQVHPGLIWCSEVNAPPQWTYLTTCLICRSSGKVWGSWSIPSFRHLSSCYVAPLCMPGGCSSVG